MKQRQGLSLLLNNSIGVTEHFLPTSNETSIFAQTIIQKYHKTKRIVAILEQLHRVTEQFSHTSNEISTSLKITMQKYQNNVGRVASSYRCKNIRFRHRGMKNGGLRIAVSKKPKECTYFVNVPLQMMQHRLHRCIEISTSVKSTIEKYQKNQSLAWSYRYQKTRRMFTMCE